MLKKNILYLLHESNICKRICTITYPWGWKDKTLITNQKNYLQKKVKMNNLVDNFNENEFIKNTIYPYNLIYKSYLENIDFLDYGYTNPSLSIALNKIRSTSKLPQLPNSINIKDVKVLSNEIKEEITTCNFKYLGYFDKEQIIHELSAGAIGPEVQHIWDQRPIKQVVNLLYESDNYYDIVEWERDLMLLNPSWQVSNINNLVNK